MAHIAIVCPPIPGHFNPIAVLGRELLRRGHRVTVFQIPGLQPAAAAEGLAFQPVGDCNAQNLLSRVIEMGKLSGLRSVRYVVECSRQISETLCEHLPAAFEKAGVDCVLADQNEPAAGSVADHVGIPFITICPGLPLNRESVVPPSFFPWGYSFHWWARMRNLAGISLADVLIAPINKTINRYRHAWRLPPIERPDDSFSRTAQLSQLVEEFDFPRQHLPRSFHYLGPFWDDGGRPIDFPYEKLNGKPLIYASLGTLQDRHSAYFQTIAEAAQDLNAQLVIPAGGTDAVAMIGLPGNPLIVKYAPQIEILKRSTLCITHAGLNTVMQSLMFGVPMIAIPITHDQPATAARVARSGTGEVIPAQKLTVKRLRTALDAVLSDPSYRWRANRFRRAIELAGGVGRAASLVEAHLPNSAGSQHYAAGTH